MMRQARIATIGWAIASSLGSLVAAQSQLPGTARISGVVVSADATSAPVRRAVVRLVGQVNTNLAAVTDDAGRFEIGGVRPGRVTIVASKPAFLTTAYGALRPGRPGTSIAIAAGQQLDGVRIVLPRGAVIAGTVLDPSGEPAADLRVSIVRAIERPRRPDARPNEGSEQEVRTDGRGQFRAYGLSPGDYLVRAHAPSQAGPGAMASVTRTEVDAELRRLQTRTRGAAPTATGAALAAPPLGREVNFVPTYHPSTPDAAAATIVRVAAGQVADGIDIALSVVPVSSASGVVRRADGAAVSVSLFVIPLGMHAPLDQFRAMTASGPPGSHAEFRISGLTPGNYAVQARTREPLLWASVPITVAGGDLDGVVLDLRPAPTVAGRVRYDAARLARPTDLGLVRLLFTESAVGSLQLGFFLGGARTAARVTVEVQRDGTFQTRGLLPGPFLITATTPGGSGPSGWWLRSVMSDGRDLLDHPFVVGDSDLTDLVVTFSDRHTEITGTLDAAPGVPAPDHFIVALPEDRALWWSGSRRFQSTRPGTDGRYRFVDLPPGDYLLAALTDLDEDTWRTREVLEQLAPAGVPLTLGEGERKVQDLRVGR
jgi:hypothetical protein